MANALYKLAKEKFLSGEIDLLTDNIKALLVDTDDYTVNLTTDEFHSDVTGAGIVSTSPNFSGKSVTLGIFDASDLTWTAVTGDQCEAIVIYKDTGTSGTSPLIAYIDTATSLPVTPNGGDIIAQWDAGANKIFAL